MNTIVSNLDSLNPDTVTSYTKFTQLSYKTNSKSFIMFYVNL